MSEAPPSPTSETTPRPRHPHKPLIALSVGISIRAILRSGKEPLDPFVLDPGRVFFGNTGEHPPTHEPSHSLARSASPARSLAEPTAQTDPTARGTLAEGCGLGPSVRA